MPRKKREFLNIKDSNLARKATGLPFFDDDEVEVLEQELPVDFTRFLNWFKSKKLKNSNEMYCLILYDVENNKIRRVLAKFLEKQGCIRLQKSVFFAQVHRKLYKEIKEIVTELQSCYENNDTIIMLPVGEDMLNSINCIGKNFDFELLTQNKHTIIF
ncbi:CRISPR-associated endonuclease Cas2 [Lacihabitans lacunae]|uniref:CRISPR-associated endoribonuclease Cas2 n=1 Tax=Lacihabitans lacunae TaxID=1028214 RepID=A0ABV7YR05_9BACT